MRHQGGARGGAGSLPDNYRAVRDLRIPRLPCLWLRLAPNRRICPCARGERALAARWGGACADPEEERGCWREALDGEGKVRPLIDGRELPAETDAPR